MSPRTIIALLAITMLAAGCGGATSEPTGPADDTGPTSYEAEMISAVLTTSVDKATKTAKAEAATEFPADTKQIYLIATLTGLPEEADLEVSWSSTRGGEPLYVSSSVGSGDFTLISKLLAPSGGFDAGEYQAFVYVENQRLGSAMFSIGETESKWTGLRELNVSAAVEAFTNKPIEPKSSFHKGIKRIYAGFLVGTADDNPYVRTAWFRGEGVMFENDLECGGDKRCIDAYELKKPIPEGDYSVEVDVNGEMLGRRSFSVKGQAVSPVVMHTALGVAKGKPKMPKKHKQLFSSKLSGLRCGVKFGTLPEKATVKVEWVAVDGGGVQHTSEATIEGGGVKTAVLEWPIDGELEPGRYKAVIFLGSRKMEELGFTVE